MQYSGFSEDDDDDDTEADEVYVPTTPPERSDAYWTNYNGNLQRHEAKFLHKLHLLQLSKTQHILKMQPVQDRESFRMCSTNLLRIEEDLAIKDTIS